MKFKYIIIDNGTGLEVPILFSKLMQHDQIVNRIGANKVVAAGFCRVTKHGEIDCWGESVSLRIKSRAALDEELIRADGNFEV